MAIVIPKVSDNWPAKLATIFGALLVVHFLLAPQYVVYLLGLVSGCLLILEWELRYRSMMINIMDDQLVRVSAEVGALNVELHAVQEKIRHLEIIK
jgi:hypothetical protein